ncbi:hypothetical protein EDD21DRAFT_441738 [Dissophora ornata]|nr:hypothetical protein EDD21DRAFT_441738 [Dissophora ornata]
MNIPYKSAELWTELIQRPDITLIDNLITQFREARAAAADTALVTDMTSSTRTPTNLLPILQVSVECIPSPMRRMATALLGIEFEDSRRLSRLMDITALQLSVLSQYTSLTSDTEEREKVIEMLVEEFSPSEINGSCIGNKSNVLHLAALLNMTSTLDLLVAHGGDPLINNGCGLNAYDIFHAVRTEWFDANGHSIQKASVYEQKATEVSHKPEVEGATTETMAPAPSIVKVSPLQIHKNGTACPGFSSTNQDKVSNGSMGYCSPEVKIRDGLQVRQPTSGSDSNDLTSMHLMEATEYQSCQSQSFDGTVFDGDEDPEYDEDLTCSLEQRLDIEQQQQHSSCRSGSDVSDKFDSGNDVGLHQYLVNYDRTSLKRPPVPPIYSILKNRYPLPILENGKEPPPEFQDYQAYISRLHLRQKSKAFVPPLAETEDPEPASRGKSVQWDTVKSVRVYRRHINPMSDNENLDDGPPVLEDYEEPVQEDIDSPTAPYIPMGSEAPSQPQCTSIYRSMGHYQQFNSSRLDLNAGGMQSSASKYGRPLPEIPSNKAAKHCWTERRALKRSANPPPRLLLSESFKRSDVERLSQDSEPLKKSFSAPLFSAGEPQVETSSPPRRVSSSSSYETSQWLSRLSKGAGLPSGPISRNDNNTEDFKSSASKSSDLRSDSPFGKVLSSLSSTLKDKVAVPSLSPPPTLSLSLPGIFPFSSLSEPPSPVLNAAINSFTFPGPNPRTSSSFDALHVGLRLPRITSPLASTLFARKSTRSPQPHSNRPVGTPPDKALLGGYCGSMHEMAAESLTLSNNESEHPVGKGRLTHKKPNLSATQQALWKRRKEVKVVIPTSHISMEKVMSMAVTSDQERSAGFDPMSPSVEWHHETSSKIENIHCAMQTTTPTTSTPCEKEVNLTGDITDVQGHIAQQARTFESFGSDTTRYSTLNAIKNSDSPLATFKNTTWKCASDIDAQSLRKTLSSCPSPSTTNTGVLYMRVKSVCDFKLPIPEENTMVSIRVDTGHEKVDTEYVPLEDINILFNQEFCLPVTPDLKITLTLHLMQAPYLVPRPLPQPTSPIPSPSKGTLRRLGNAILGSQYAPNIPSKTNTPFDRKRRPLLPPLFRRHSVRSTPDSGESRTTLASAMEVHSRQPGVSSRSGSESESSGTSFNPSRSASRQSIDPSSTTTSVSSISSSTKENVFFKLKKRIRLIHNISSTQRLQHPNETSFPSQYQPQGVQKFNNHPLLINSPQPHSSKLPQISLSVLQQTETPLQILSRHILFEDELCIARCDIAFSAIQSSCENQIIPVEFQTTNNWVDLSDYAHATTLFRSGCASPGSTSPIPRDLPKDHPNGNDMLTGDESIIGRIKTLICFIPGPELDPEAAIYEDENYVPTEPQNLVECQTGLEYFHWQDLPRFQGSLFYLTEQRTWKQGWFCIAGSKLWHCRTPQTSATSGLERLRCLYLENVRQIETNHGIFNAVARETYEKEQGPWHSENGGDNPKGLFCELETQEDEPFYPVRHGFRLRLRVHESGVQDFYADSQDEAQSWVAALMAGCRDRPQRPYWMHGDR